MYDGSACGRNCGCDDRKQQHDDHNAFIDLSVLAFLGVHALGFSRLGHVHRGTARGLRGPEKIREN